MPSFLSPLVKEPDSAWMLRNRRTQQVLSAALETAFDSESRKRGLLGREGLPAGAALVIAPCPSVHTFFMKFPIDVIFVAKDGRVVKVCEREPAWRIAIGWGAFAVVEMAAGSVATCPVSRGDYLDLERADRP